MGACDVALLLGTHIFLTVRAGLHSTQKLPQTRFACRGSGSVRKGRGDISSFSALATALLATIGTGSMVGVATAILAGGRAPSSGCGSRACSAWLKYVEVYASVRYRVRSHAGNMLGGAMYARGAAPSRAKTARALGAKMRRHRIRRVRRRRHHRHRLGSAGNVHDPASSRPRFQHPPTGRSASPSSTGGHRHLRRRAVHLARVRKLVPSPAVAYAGGIVILLMNACPRQRDRPHLRGKCAFTPEGRVRRRVGSGLLMALQFGCARGCSPTSRALAPPPSSRRPLRRKTLPNRRLSP